MDFSSVEGNVGVNSEVGLILPTYCEAASIEKLVHEIEGLNLNISILVIDDSSPDHTADMVRKLQGEYKNILLRVRPKKSGLGTAITDGFKIFLSFAKPPKYIVTMDADYSHNPADVPSVVSAAKEVKGLAIGSRYCEGGRVANWSMVRKLISRAANLLLASPLLSSSFLMGKRARGTSINDYTSGLRCYSTDLVRQIVNDLHSQTYEIQIETIRQSYRRAFEIRETPITFVSRKRGKSKLTINEIKEFSFYILRKVVLKRS
jgi:dolichol-phosphate mannosyltransferase